MPAALRGMHVGSVPCQQDTAAPVRRRLPGRVGEPGDPAGTAQTEVRPVDGDQRFVQVVHARGSRVVDLALGEQDPDQLPVRRAPERVGPEAVVPEAELRLLGHRHLGDHPARRGIQAREVDAGGLAHQAAAAVAADQVPRSEPLAAGHLDLDSVVVLGDALDHAVTEDLDAEVADPVGEDGLEPALWQGKHVVVARGQVVDVEPDPGVPVARDDVPRVQEPLCDATLVEHLDGAREEPQGPGAIDLLGASPLHDGDVDSRQRELAGQHQPGRTPACDEYLVLDHRPSPCADSAAVALSGRGFSPAVVALPQAPVCAIRWS
jgi:hypothetical protein